MAGPPPPRRFRSPSRQQAVAARRRTIELSSPIARADRHVRSLTDGRWSGMRHTPPTSGSCGGHPAHQRRTPHSRVGANIATSGRRTLARDEVQQCRTAARYRRPRCRNEADAIARAGSEAARVFEVAVGGSRIVRPRRGAVRRAAGPARRALRRTRPRRRGACGAAASAWPESVSPRCDPTAARGSSRSR
jgi:hypothetical protein